MYNLTYSIFWKVQNVVATVNLDCKLDLKSIALHARNAEYNPKRFAAVIMRIREPKSTALIFASGKMVSKRRNMQKVRFQKYQEITSVTSLCVLQVCTGAKSENESRLAARKVSFVVYREMQYRLPWDIPSSTLHFCRTFLIGMISCITASNISPIIRVQYARILQKLGFEVTFKEFKIQNMVGSCDVKFPIRLEGLASTHSIFSSVSKMTVWKLS